MDTNRFINQIIDLSDPHMMSFLECFEKLDLKKLDKYGIEGYAAFIERKLNKYQNLSSINSGDIEKIKDGSDPEFNRPCCRIITVYFDNACLAIN